MLFAWKNESKTLDKIKKELRLSIVPILSYLYLTLRLFFFLNFISFGMTWLYRRFYMSQWHLGCTKCTCLVWMWGQGGAQGDFSPLPLSNSSSLKAAGELRISLHSGRADIWSLSPTEQLSSLHLQVYTLPFSILYWHNPIIQRYVKFNLSV